MIDEGILFIELFEDALIGIAGQYHRPSIAIYDKEKVIEILKEDMGDEEAIEYFRTNVYSNWGGEQTPMFLSRIEGLE